MAQARASPWLRAGAPVGRGYLTFGSQAALVRWKGDATSGRAWQFAHVLLGQATMLSASYALQLPDVSANLLRRSWDRRLPQVAGTSLSIRSGSSAIEGR